MKSTSLSCVWFSLLLAFCPLPAVAYEARIDVDAALTKHPVNRLILGSNIQWVDLGDGIISPDRTFRPAMLAAAEKVGPTALRYPGGSHADLYRWQDGVGQQRGKGEHFFNGATQPVEFGTDEFMQLCARLGAQPIFTVNVASATAQDAADWVRYVSSPERPRAPAAQWWEIGNEPYLREDRRKALALGADEFVRRAQPIMDAMRAQNPSLKVGIPLRSDRLGGRPATPYPGFNDKVLSQLHDIDFVSLHDAYAPATFNEKYSDKDLFLALMAAPDQVAEDFQKTREQL